jgi:uncharacterized membrane protein
LERRTASLTNKNPRPKPGNSFVRTEALLRLLTFSVSLLAPLAGILRMLLGAGRMFFALHVVAFSVLFSRGAMGLGGILAPYCFGRADCFANAAPSIIDLVKIGMCNRQVG